MIMRLGQVSPVFNASDIKEALRSGHFNGILIIEVNNPHNSRLDDHLGALTTRE
jgi:hypothetical protein